MPDRPASEETRATFQPCFLSSGELSGLLRARELSLATMKRVRRNLVAAFGYDLLAVPLAAGALVSPMLAGAAMSLSAVAVMGSSLRRGFSCR